MKRLFTWLLPLLLLPMALTAAEREIDEGIDYKKLSPAMNTAAPEGKVEVLEMFWYGCPHCYQLEPALEKWVHDNADKIHFVRRPSMLNPQWETHARAYYALQALDEVDRMHNILFKALHEEKRRLNDVDALAEFFAAHDVDEAKFRKTFRSFYVETNIRRERALAKRGFASGVPAVVIDGQYFTDTTIGGGYKGMIEVMSFLVDKARNGG